MRSTLTTLALCMLSTGAAAQYTGEPPQVVGGTQNIAPVAGLFNDIRGAMANTIGIGVQNIQQFETRPWTGQNPPATPGLFYLAFTHANGAWTGLWDSTAPTGSQFTPLNDFQNLDQVGLFSLSVSRDHLFSSLGGRTAVEAIEAGVPVRTVWLAICEAYDVPPKER